MSYQDELKTINWQKKRLFIFERDKWKCQSVNCKTPEHQLQVHHVDYISGAKAWDHPDDMLVTLCATCHAKEKDRNQLESHLAQTFRMKGFLISDLLALGCKIDTDDNFTNSLLKILREMQNG